MMNDEKKSKENEGEELHDDEIVSLTGPAVRPNTSTLLERIKATLAGTSPDRWEQAGDELDSTRKYQKPQDTWEQLFCTDTKSGVLVLRCSLPVKSNFFGGGYSFVEAGIPSYFVEIRSRGWAPKMLIDPFYRSSGGVDKNYQILADGDVARHLYNEVEVAVKGYRENLRRDFTDSVERLMANIHEQVKGTAADDWAPQKDEPGYIGYVGDINGMSVSVGKAVRDRSATYAMTLSKFGLKWECRDMNVIMEVFAIVDDSVRHASLEQLGKVLEDML